MSTAIAICGQCNKYGPCKVEKGAKGNPWRCIATSKCVKRTFG